MVFFFMNGPTSIAYIAVYFYVKLKQDNQETSGSKCSLYCTLKTKCLKRSFSIPQITAPSATIQNSLCCTTTITNASFPQFGHHICYHIKVGAPEKLTVSGGHGTRPALAHYSNLQAHITSPPSHCVPCLIMRVAVRRLFFLLNINTSCLLSTTMEQSTLSQLFKKEPKGLKMREKKKRERNKEGQRQL